MHVTFALFADAANLSQEGKLNILGVFDAVQVGQLPTVHRNASLVMRLKGTTEDAGSHTVTLRWVGPDGVELWNSQGELRVEVPVQGVGEMDLPLIASIDLPMEQPGAHAMHIALDDRPSATVPLHVRAALPPFNPPGGLLS
jgi:hypothetical protein